MKQTMYLIALTAVRANAEWKVIYDRLVPRLCAWDDRTKRYRAKKRVITRIAGQMTNMVYVFLRRDYEMLLAVEPGYKAPQPQLYGRSIHSAHRTGKLPR